MWIMVAGPYTTGARTEADRATHLRALNAAALQLFRKGHVPIVGVNSALHMLAAAEGLSYEEVMLPLSRALAERCDAVLRLEGRSAGADAEVAQIQCRGGRVFRSVAEVPNEMESE